METPTLLKILEGGDLRSDGESDQLVSKVLQNTHLLPNVIEGLTVKDPVVRGRTRAHVNYLGLGKRLTASLMNFRIGSL